MNPGFLFYTVLLLILSFPTFAQDELIAEITEKAEDIEEIVIEWRRDIHQNPELSNREFRTAAKVAAHLRDLGFEVDTGIAHTGVVGVLRGKGEGPVVALRADMDALPVTERVDVPFASTVRSTYLGQEVGVMHACGHDTHVAMLMGAASILNDLKDRLNGTIVFIFQPAEEGPPPGEKGGAPLMVEEGVIDKYGIDVIFGQHISSGLPVGHITYKTRGLLAAADRFVIQVKGKQSHGSRPWTSVDPIVTSAQIIMGLQTIISRQTELTKEAAVITVGKFTSGVRNNIIPEEAEMIGTIRTLDTTMQNLIHEKMHRTVEHIAKSMGAEATLTIEKNLPVTFNDPELTQQMIGTLYKVAGEEKVRVIPPITGAEDFSFFANEVPGMLFFLGGMPADMDPIDAPPHHTPDFYIDESGLRLGVIALASLAVEYINGQ